MSPAHLDRALRWAMALAALAAVGAAACNIQPQPLPPGSTVAADGGLPREPQGDAGGSQGAPGMAGTPGGGAGDADAAPAPGDVPDGGDAGPDAADAGDGARDGGDGGDAGVDDAATDATGGG